MRQTVRVVALFGSGTILLSFALVVVSQTAQVVQLASAAHPVLGKVVLGGLLTVYAVAIGYPVVLVLRLPSPLVPPAESEGPEFDEHIRRLGERLTISPHLAGRDLTDRQGIEEALGVLDEKVNRIVKETASGVFLATAVSQSGRLDGLLVLTAQARMVWKIAHVYYQRPALRDLTHLYANVAATSFLAGELQDLDLSDQVEPVLSAAMGALGASIPGLQVAGSILANCVLDGSANAFLTLRVGMIAKRYCGALVVEPAGAVRRAATAEAAGYLGGIVADGTRRVSKAVLRASVDKVGGAVSGAADYARGAGARFFARLKLPRAQGQPGAG
jgi:hypothetical protein